MNIHESTLKEGLNAIKSMLDVHCDSCGCILLKGWNNNNKKTYYYCSGYKCELEGKINWNGK